MITLPPPPIVPGYDPADYEICACCHIEKRGEDHRPHSMGVVAAECTMNRWKPLDLSTWADRENWRVFLAVVTARYVACPECGANTRVMNNGKLIHHKRAVRPSDGRKRKPVDCEGAGFPACPPLPREAA